MDKEFDIIVFGVGFTGTLVVRYLSEQKGIKLGVAGRNKLKIKTLLEKEGLSVPIIIADSFDEESLNAMVKRTKVVISTAGPYLIFGELLVKSCATHKTHYCDLTGETPFSANMNSAYSDLALASKSLIIHSCGFDSIPGDLCTFLAVQKLKSLASDVKVGKVLSSYKVKGGPSGGTLATVLNMLSEGSENQAINRDPFVLSPKRANHKVSPFLYQQATFNNKTTWGAFFVMGPGNTQLVRRTWGLLELAQDKESKLLSYGPDFQYEECIETNGKISAILTSLALYIGFGILMFFSPARWALSKYGTQPGNGPSVETQISGSFSVNTIAKSVDEKLEVQTTLKGRGDPGYFLTAKMISECALAIVKDYDQLPTIAKSGGFLTPAVAFGNVLVQRLESTGYFSFSSS